MGTTARPTSGTRWRTWALVVLVALGLVRAGSWALLLEVPSPIDEVQHVAYVETLVTELRPPVIGHDVIPPSMARLAKQSPTFAMRARPVSDDPTEPGWGPVGQSYEGGQTPLGYAPFVPVWAVARHLSPALGLALMRLVAVLLAVLPILLLVRAGRRLFPDRPAVGHLAAAVYLAVPAAWAHTAIPAGDVLVPTVGVLALLAVVSVEDRAADRRSALHVGLAAAGMLLVKPTTLGMVPLVLLAGLAVAARHLGARRWWAWTGVAAVASIVPLLPWLAWNLVAYGSPSGAEANDAILGGAQFDIPFGGEALRVHTQSALGGLFGVPRADVAWETLNLRWLAVLLVATVAGTAVAVRRGRRDRAWRLPALALALPVTYAGMLVVIFVIFDGRSSVVGRHLLAALPLACLAIAAGAVIAAGRRVGSAALLVVAAVALWPREAQLTERFLATTYFDGAPQAALVAQDDLAVGVRPVTELAVEVDCPVRYVDVVTDGAEVSGVSIDGGTLAGHTVHQSVVRPAWTRVEVATPRPRVTLQFDTPQPRLPVTASGEAAHRAWCEHADPRAATWAAMHDPLRPVDLPWGLVRTGVWTLRWGAPAAALALAAWLVVPFRRLR